ncbi:MAG: hypothetical protein LBQ94_04460 [Treponema sp.]|jgi:hypothetical protein|nr:hypothetical protein [Treponema sp.]
MNLKKCGKIFFAFIFLSIFILGNLSAQDVVLADIKETSASLLIDGDLTGRLSIRDENDFLVAELTKVNNSPMELGFEPGLYRITIQRGDNFYRAEVVLRENTRTILRMSDFALIASAAENRTRDQDETEKNIYSFFMNIVNEPFPFPLFGFVNIARGSHGLAQVGFVNWNSENFSGLQAGFVNTIGGELRGVQAGYVNTAIDGVEGAQGGFINITAGDTRGIQGGFVNTTGSFLGFQGGFVNVATRGGRGVQAGFVNVSLQKLRGTQLGFVNYADSFEGGIPIGFISIVRNGGYRAVEYNFTEFHPLGLGLKLGVEKFYTTIYVAYNPINGNALENLATGFGIGSIIPIGGSFFFNPEMSILSSPVIDQDLRSLVPFFGYRLGKHFSISAGPSVTWVYTYSYDEQQVQQKPIFKIAEYTFAEDQWVKKSIVVGARASVRFIF